MNDEAILNDSFIFDPGLRFCKIVRALGMTIKYNMLELVEANISVAAMTSLKSPS